MGPKQKAADKKEQAEERATQKAQVKQHWQNTKRDDSISNLMCNICERAW